MSKMAGGQSHDCAPKDWRKTANLTGDYDLDETIAHRTNESLPEALKQHIRQPHKAYGRRH